MNGFTPVTYIEVKDTGDGRGKGAFATTERQSWSNEEGEKILPKGLILCMYEGEILTGRQATARINDWPPREEYMLFYRPPPHRREMCVDAYDQGNTARFINHSKTRANVKFFLLGADTDGSDPRPAVVTLRNIKHGEELLVDYGDRRPDAVKDSPWLKE